MRLSLSGVPGLVQQGSLPMVLDGFFKLYRRFAMEELRGHDGHRGNVWACVRHVQSRWVKNHHRPAFWGSPCANTRTICAASGTLSSGLQAPAPLIPDQCEHETVALAVDDARWRQQVRRSTTQFWLQSLGLSHRQKGQVIYAVHLHTPSNVRKFEASFCGCSNDEFSTATMYRHHIARKNHRVDFCQRHTDSP